MKINYQYTDLSKIKINSFFHTFASMNLSAEKIAEMLGGIIEGDKAVSISKLAKIDNGDKNSLSFLGNPKYNNSLYKSNSSIILVKRDFVLEEPVQQTLIRVDDPNESFSVLLDFFSKKKSNVTGISENSVISSSVKYHPDLFFGDFSVCNNGSILGKNVKIYSQVFIGENVTIGDDTVIHPGVKIYDNSIIGSDCIIHSGTVIGSDGFGFNIDNEGNQKKVSHNGNVVIEDNVEIGANCTVDRATLGSTILKKGVKIDNLIQIAHNVEIGQNTVIAGCTGIAGSTSIGKNCMIGGQVGIGGHLKIGDRVKIQAKSGILKNIESDSSVMGYPALNYRDYNRSYVHFKNFPSIMKSIESIIKSKKDA